MAILEAARIPATIRREKGHDIAAACGQLRRPDHAGGGGYYVRLSALNRNTLVYDPWSPKLFPSAARGC
ncbi:MAG: hypothetical protein WDN28_07930 [Chthoniobacter sp.]